MDFAAVQPVDGRLGLSQPGVVHADMDISAVDPVDRGLNVRHRRDSLIAGVLRGVGQLSHRGHVA